MWFGDDAPTAVTYWVPEGNLRELHVKLDKLVKKAQRLGVGAIAYAVGTPEDRPYVQYESDDPYSTETRYAPYKPPLPGTPPPRHPPRIVYFKFFPVSVTGTTPRIAGWAFVATLQHLTDDTGKTVNLLRVVPGFVERLPEQYRHADASNCDHCCRTIRSRKDTYILRNDETGQYMQVGRNCTQDFLGGKDPHAVAQYLESLLAALRTAGELSDEEGFGGGGRGEQRFPMSAFLTQVAAVVRVHGWISRGKARDSGDQATADITLEVLEPPGSVGPQARRQWEALVAKFAPNDDDKQMAEAALEYARETLSDNPDRDDYEHNLYVALTQPVIGRRLAGITASVIPYYLRSVQRKVERESAGESHWIGEVGERMDLIVKPLMVKPIETQFGMSYLHKFVTPDGALLTWFASSNPEVKIGEEYQITGTIKKHDDYKGVKQTVITRVTVWTEEGREQARIAAEAKAEKAAAKAERAAVKAAKAAAREAKAAAKAAKAQGLGDWDGRMRVQHLDRRSWVFVNNAAEPDADENDRMLLAIALGEDERDELEAYVLGSTPTGGAVIAMVSDGGEIDRFRVE
jgi:hypothetical protein